MNIQCRHGALILALLSATTAAIAQPIEASSIPAQSFAASSNFYVGASVGRDMTTANSQVSTTANSDPTRTIKLNTSVNGFSGGLFAGYKHSINDRFFAAAEAFAELDSTHGYTNDYNSSSTMLSFKKTHTYGLSILPGFQVTPSTSVYARLGVASAQFKYTQGAFTTPAFPQGIANTSTRTGFQFGVGSEFAMTQNLSLRGEYDRTNYGTQNFANTYDDGLGTVSQDSIQNKYSSDEFKLGLSWAF